MKYLKRFESNADNVSSIESILDDHLDEFPDDFTYEIIRGFDSLQIILHYSPGAIYYESCPISHTLVGIKYKLNRLSALTIQTKLKDRSSKIIFLNTINEIDSFKRIYALTNYKVNAFNFEFNSVDLVLKTIL